ncbi:MAG: type II secretion system F family protein [Pirellulaceae bacterium]|nr:type II secretion system F family protein [Pirellulaceae bacterium]
MATISTRSLIQLCQRVGTSLRAGIDVRKVWEMETRHASGTLKLELDRIRLRVAQGDPVFEAMKTAGGYFPPMFVQMVEVGEQTGKLDEVLLRLAEHYEHQAQMRRSFWFGIAWPLFELAFAVLIIGFLIFILGVVSGMRGGEPVDVLGIGLVGTRGAILWFTGCGILAGGVAWLALAISRGWLGPKPMLIAMRIPLLGQCLESLALARLTWSLAMSLDSEMSARRAVELSIRAAQNPYYEAALRRVTDGIRQNMQFHESFRLAGVFPDEFLHALEAAELAGATHEALLRLAALYEDKSRTAMRMLTGIATVAVMLLVFGVLIFAIFMLAWQVYLKPIYETLDMIESGRI